MTYRSQSLFVIARLFNDLGGAPKHTYVDGAGELTSEVAQQYFAHANTSFNKTEASEHWRLGKPERAHGSLKGATNACLHHANAPLKFWYLALSRDVATSVVKKTPFPNSHERTSTDIMMLVAFYSFSCFGSPRQVFPNNFFCRT